MHNTKQHRFMTLLVVATSWLAGPRVHSDVVTDWSTTACEIAVAGKLPSGAAYRAAAAVQTAVFDAVNGITKRYPQAHGDLQATPGASVDAAVTFTYSGSMVALWRCLHLSGTHRWTPGTTIHTEPIRNYSFDTRYNQIKNMPPGTPVMISPFNLDYYEVHEE